MDQLIAEEKGGDRSIKNNQSVLLRNGVVPEELKARFNKALKQYQQRKEERPLLFSELTRFNTWFMLHPEKITLKLRAVLGLKEDDATLHKPQILVNLAKDNGVAACRHPYGLGRTH